MGKLLTPGSPQFNLNLKTAGLEEQDPAQMRVLRIGIDDDGPKRKHLSRLRHPLKPVLGGADGIYYRDRRLPFLTANQSAITVSTTQKALWTPGATSPTILPANYWTVGKTVKLTVNFSWTAVANTNAITAAMAYGAADAPAAVVLTAAVTPVSSTTVFGVFMEGYATCRSIGTAGTLSMWGLCVMPSGLCTTGYMPYPTGGVTVVSTIDTTVGTNGPFFEAQRGTAAGDTVVATDLIFEALN